MPYGSYNNYIQRRALSASGGCCCPTGPSGPVGPSGATGPLGPSGIGDTHTGPTGATGPGGCLL